MISDQETGAGFASQGLGPDPVSLVRVPADRKPRWPGIDLRLPFFGQGRSVILVDVLIDRRPMLPRISPVASDDAATFATCRPLFPWDVVTRHHVSPVPL